MAIHLRYFERKDGTIMLAPDDGKYKCPCPPDCIEKEANTLHEVKHVEKLLQMDTAFRLEREYKTHSEAFAEGKRRVRDNLMYRMQSVDCSQYEKDVIRHWIQASDHKRAEMEKKFVGGVISYLPALHNDEKSCSNSMLEKLDL